jgi:hypothetical protein
MKFKNIVRICNARESRLSPVACLPGQWHPDLKNRPDMQCPGVPAFAGGMPVGAMAS